VIDAKVSAVDGTPLATAFVTVSNGDAVALAKIPTSCTKKEQVYKKPFSQLN
jgi:hypothetical protein